MNNYFTLLTSPQCADIITAEDFNSTNIAPVLRTILRQSKVSVIFIKRSGESRSMKCTLVSDFLPNDERDIYTEVDDNDPHIRVWDLQKKGWRSFNIDQLQAFHERGGSVSMIIDHVNET